MRKLVLVAATFSVLAVAAQAAPTAPPRKLGLWTQTINSPPNPQMIMKLCVDAATNAKVSALGSQLGSTRCASQTMTPIPGGWSFRSVCDMGPGGKTTSTGTAIGDFNSAYTVKATTVTTGAAYAAGNGTHNTTMTARWSGACPAGTKGGDMIMPGGMKVNILQAPGR